MVCSDRPVGLKLVLIDKWKDGCVEMVKRSMVGWWGDREDSGVSRPAWKTTVFFLHPDSSWRFRKSPLAVSFTWKLASDSLGDHNIVSVCNPILFKTWLETNVSWLNCLFVLELWLSAPPPLLLTLKGSWAEGNSLFFLGSKFPVLTSLLSSPISLILMLPKYLVRYKRIASNCSLNCPISKNVPFSPVIPELSENYSTRKRNDRLERLLLLEFVPCISMKATWRSEKKTKTGFWIRFRGKWNNQ